MLRQPAVAGHFYQGTPSALKDQIEGFLVPDARKIKAKGILCPHAGLVYSGSVAGAVYSSIELPDTFVLIGPNHTGLGAPLSVMTSGPWMTPLGMVAVDEGLARSVQSKSRRIEEDTLAHLREHSLEVQLPFIQYLKKEFTIVPIQMMDTRLDTCIELGNALAAAIRELKREVLIIASSDMSHYVPAKVADKKDHLAIKRILELDAKGLYHTVREEGISMCGFGPAVAMLTACKDLGATKAELIKYAHSGEVSGDYEQVVGYAGIVVV
jgi:AmmeMemoRadiSam system protein B